MPDNLQRITRAGIIAGLYITLTMLLGQFSFSVIQVRISESLSVLPILYPEAIPALFIGCLISNFFGGLGLIDIIGGSLVTLAAAIITRRLRSSWIAYLSPVVLNAFLVSIYLSLILKIPYWITVLTVGAGQAVAVYGLGYPLIKMLRKLNIDNRN